MKFDTDINCLYPQVILTQRFRDFAPYCSALEFCGNFHIIKDKNKIFHEVYTLLDTFSIPLPNRDENCRTWSKDLRERHNIMHSAVNSLRYYHPSLGWIPVFQIVGCGHCELCSEKKQYQWVLRTQLESTIYTSRPLFFTLTYDEDHNDGSLHKEHFELFMKRFRVETNRRLNQMLYERSVLNSYKGQYDINLTFVSEYQSKPIYVNPDFPFFREAYKATTNLKDWQIKRKFMDQNHTEFRWFACGEYGTHTARPHYHVLLFNFPIIYDEIGTLEFAKRVITDTWQFGDFGNSYTDSRGICGKELDITFADSNVGKYVSKYVAKQVSENGDIFAPLSSLKTAEPFIKYSKGYGFPQPVIDNLNSLLDNNPCIEKFSLYDSDLNEIEVPFLECVKRRLLPSVSQMASVTLPSTHRHVNYDTGEITEVHDVVNICKRCRDMYTDISHILKAYPLILDLYERFPSTFALYPNIAMLFESRWSYLLNLQLKCEEYVDGILCYKPFDRCGCRYINDKGRLILDNLESDLTYIYSDAENLLELCKKCKFSPYEMRGYAGLHTLRYLNSLKKDRVKYDPIDHLITKRIHDNASKYRQVF